MEITKEQYLAALEIVTEYHQQILNDQIQVGQLSKPKTRDFLNQYGNEMSKKLYNILNETVIEGEKGRFDSYKQYLYVENLTKNNCAKLRNFGKKTWTELDTLFDKYYK